MSQGIVSSPVGTCQLQLSTPSFRASPARKQWHAQARAISEFANAVLSACTVAGDESAEASSASMVCGKRNKMGTLPCCTTSARSLHLLFFRHIMTRSRVEQLLRSLHNGKRHDEKQLSSKAYLCTLPRSARELSCHHHRAPHPKPVSSKMLPSTSHPQQL